MLQTREYGLGELIYLPVKQQIDSEQTGPLGNGVVCKQDLDDKTTDVAKAVPKFDAQRHLEAEWFSPRPQRSASADPANTNEEQGWRRFRGSPRPRPRIRG